MTAQPPQPCRRIPAYVAYHARQRPEKTAVIRNGSAITYATLHRDLTRMIHALAGFGLAPGQIAAVSHDDLYIQLLIVFGFEALGVVTGSYRPSEAQESAGLIAIADIVLAQYPVAHSTGGRIVELTEDYLDAALDARATHVAISVAPACATDPLVIFRSSGTTGSPKLMLLSYGILNARLAHRRPRNNWLGLNGQSRFFAVMHFSVSATYGAAHTCLRLGACFMFDTTRPAAKSIRDLNPTNLIILPYHLRKMLEKLPAGTAPLLPGLTVQCIGARAHDDLRKGALQKLCGHINELYGTNEIGPAGDVDLDGNITLPAGMEAQVAARDGQLSADEIGPLRLRSPAMVTSYLNNPTASAAMFQADWFYPGDLAMFTESGQLRLIGRRADVLNLGGVKVAAAGLEAEIMRFPGVLDVALAQPATNARTTRVAVCVVLSHGFDMQAFLAAIRPVINYPFTVNPLKNIPRTIEGKIKRAELQDIVLASIKPDPAAQHLYQDAL